MEVIEEEGDLVGVWSLLGKIGDPSSTFKERKYSYLILVTALTN